MPNKHIPLSCFLVFFTVVNCARNLDPATRAQNEKTFHSNIRGTSMLDLPSAYPIPLFKKVTERILDPSTLNSQNNSDGKIRLWTNLSHVDAKHSLAQQATFKFNFFPDRSPRAALKRPSSAHTVSPTPQDPSWVFHASSTPAPAPPRTVTSTNAGSELTTWHYKGSGYLFESTTSSKVREMSYGKLMHFDNYLIVTHCSAKEVLILFITDAYRVRKTVMDIRIHGLIEFAQGNPGLGVTGLILKDTDEGFQAQFVSGSLEFVVDGKPLFPTSFNWSRLDFQQITVTDAAKAITLTIKMNIQGSPIATKTPVELYQPHLMGKYRDLAILNRQTLNQEVVAEPKNQHVPFFVSEESEFSEESYFSSLESPKQFPSPLGSPAQPSVRSALPTRLEPKEQPMQQFSGDFPNAFHSYEGSTQLEVSRHHYGIMFSGEEYRILLASVGSNSAILVIEDENTDAAITLNSVITNGLSTAAIQIKGLSGLLVREESPRVMEFVNGPLTVKFANSKTLTSQTLPDLRLSWEYRISDSSGKFSVLFKRSYRHLKGARGQMTQ